MKKSRLQQLAGIKKPLNEGYAWERDDSGALPTLESSTAKHAESLKEAAPGKSDPNALKAAFVAINQSDETNNLAVKTGGNTLEAIRNGYYALSDNLPNLINDLQKAIKLHAKINPKNMDQIAVLQNELEIYKGIQTLVDESAIGTVL